MQILQDFIFVIIHPSRTQHVDLQMLRPMTKSPLELLPHHLPHSAGLHYMDFTACTRLFRDCLFLQTARHARFLPFLPLFFFSEAVHNCGSGPTTILVDPQSCFSANKPLLSAFAASNSGSRLLLATAQDADVMIDERYYAECDGLETG